jgi:hypothetical protein
MTTPPPCRSDLFLARSLIRQWEGDGTGKVSSSARAPLLPGGLLRQLGLVKLPRTAARRAPLWLRNSDFR